jgi:hypothetical protein
MTERAVRYVIMESCMQPSGAYADTQGSYGEEDAARQAFAVAYFRGPAYGIMWSKSMTLLRTWFDAEGYHREVLAERTSGPWIQDHVERAYGIDFEIA